MPALLTRLSQPFQSTYAKPPARAPLLDTCAWSGSTLYGKRRKVPCPAPCTSQPAGREQRPYASSDCRFRGRRAAGLDATVRLPFTNPEIRATCRGVSLYRRQVAPVSFWLVQRWLHGFHGSAPRTRLLDSWASPPFFASAPREGSVTRVTASPSLIRQALLQ